jgi:hypothetical protein
MVFSLIDPIRFRDQCTEEEGGDWPDKPCLGEGNAEPVAGGRARGERARLF